MINSLRSAHRATILTLVLLLPAIIVGGLLARRSFPRSAKLPEESLRFDRSGQFALWSDVKLKVRFDRPVKANERAILYAIPSEELKEPDVLLYWDDQQSEKPSERAILLGSLKGNQMRRVSIPLTIPESSGFLILYSLGHDKVLGTSAWRMAVGSGSPQ